MRPKWWAQWWAHLRLARAPRRGSSVVHIATSRWSLAAGPGLSRRRPRVRVPSTPPTFFKLVNKLNLTNCSERGDHRVQLHRNGRHTENTVDDGIRIGRNDRLGM
jgi:hypothetical protein